jgi:hypothetical protein
MKFQISQNSKIIDWRINLKINRFRLLEGRIRKPMESESKSTQIPESKVDPRMAAAKDINARICMGN